MKINQQRYRCKALLPEARNPSLLADQASINLITLFKKTSEYYRYCKQSAVWPSASQTDPHVFGAGARANLRSKFSNNREEMEYGALQTGIACTKQSNGCLWQSGNKKAGLAAGFKGSTTKSGI